MIIDPHKLDSDIRNAGLLPQAVAAVTLPFRSLWQTGHRLKHPAARRLPEVRLRVHRYPPGIAVDRFTGFLMARFFGCVLDERSETRGQRPRYAQRPVFGPETSPDPEQPVT